MFTILTKEKTQKRITKTVAKHFMVLMQPVEAFAMLLKQVFSFRAQVFLYTTH